MFGVLAAGSLVVMMFAIIVDVVYRWVTNGSVPSLVEIAETSLVAAIFLGLGWTTVVGGHVSMSMITDRLPQGIARVVNTLTWTICSTITVWLVYSSVIRAISSTNTSETRMGFVQWPVWPTRWILVAGLICLLLACLVNLVRSLIGETPMAKTHDEVEAAIEGAV